MLKHTAFILTIFIALFTACASGDSNKMDTGDHGASEPGINIDISTVATTVDPVCGMNLANHKIPDSSSYNGHLYIFCSKECKAKFVEDPTKYIKENY